MRSIRLTSVGVRYWVLGAILFSIALASVGRITGSRFIGKLANVGSKYGESHLYGEGGFVELGSLEGLKSGGRENELLNATKLDLLLYEPFDRQQVDAPIVLDCGRLPVMPNVEQIRIAARHVRDLSSLRRHPKLSRILLDSVELVDNSGRVLEALDSSDLPDELEVLRLQRSAIRDASSLSRMKKLKCLNLCLTEVERLPMEPMPLLEEIHLIGCPNVTTSELARFSSLNPNCRVRFGWKDTLLQDLKHADRVQFPSGEVRGRKDVEKLLAIVDVEENAKSQRIYDYSPSYIFYQGSNVIGELRLEVSIGWEFWPAEISLTRLSLIDLRANGYME